MTEYRASFDAAIRFSNGGDLVVHGFRVDVPAAGIGEGPSPCGHSPGFPLNRQRPGRQIAAFHRQHFVNRRGIVIPMDFLNLLFHDMIRDILV